MKQKLSVSIEENTVKKLDDIVSEGAFRNKSHFIELAVNKLMLEVKK